MMLIIPVWTVIQNFFGTVGQRWRGLGSNLPAKFLITGSLMYLVGCFQGSIEALRVLQRPTHFTDFVIGHSHITIFGTFVIWALAGAVYVWPRITASATWSLALGNGAFWLITAGITAMFVVLVTQGLIQGVMLMRGAEWLDSVNAMRPWWWVRTLTGLAMDVGNSLLVLTLTLGSLGTRRPATIGDGGRCRSRASTRGISLTCSRHAASAPICPGSASSTATTGTTRITGIHA